MCKAKIYSITKTTLTKPPIIHSSLKLVDQTYTNEQGGKQGILPIDWRDLFKVKCSKITVVMLAQFINLLKVIVLCNLKWVNLMLYKLYLTKAAKSKSTGIEKILWTYLVYRICQLRYENPTQAQMEYLDNSTSHATTM